MVEQLICNEKVAGSSPASSTNINIMDILEINLPAKRVIKEKKDYTDWVKMYSYFKALGPEYNALTAICKKNAIKEGQWHD